MKIKTPRLNVSRRLSFRLAPTFTAFFILALRVLVPLAGARANTIAENTGGDGGNTFENFIGQSFTTVTVSPESNIVFNLFSEVPPTTPYAVGTGFLLSMQYTGTPSALSSATPGFLGQATASGGFYTFDPSLLLLPGTQYFFYENGFSSSGTFTGGNDYAGGQAYFTSSASSNFVPDFGLSANFRVTGSPTNGVPDSGSTWTLFLLSMTATFGLKFFVRPLA